VGKATRGVAAGLGFVGAVLCTIPAPKAATSSIEECDARVRDRPDDFESYRCYDLYGQAVGDNRAPQARLEAIVAREPGNVHARLFLGRLLGLVDSGRAMDLMTGAIEHYRRSGDAASEAWARAFRLHLLVVRQRFDEAREQAAAAARLAEAQPDLPLKALVAVEGCPPARVGKTSCSRRGRSGISTSTRPSWCSPRAAPRRDRS
jgi:hypothetical protein